MVNQSNTLTHKVNFWDIILGFIVVSTLICAHLSSGEYPHISNHITRFLIVLGVLVQIPLVFTKPNYMGYFTRSIRIPFLFLISFFVIVLFQYLFGLKVLNIGIGSINPLATQSNFYQLILYAAFFIFCLQQYSFRKEWVERYVFILISILFLLTLWGLAEKFLGTRLWGYKSLGQNSFGSFLNPNHYGGCVALLLPLLFFYLLEQYKSNHESLFKKIFYFFDSGVCFIFFLVVLVIAGCFLSDARLATGVILVSVFFQWIVSRKNIPLKYFIVFSSVITLGTILIFGYFGFETILRTFNLSAFIAAGAERAQVFIESLKILLYFPVFGSGLGTYQYISPFVISVLSDTHIWHHVHNDFIQLLVETGVLGFTLFFAAIGMLVYLNGPGKKSSERGKSQMLKVQAVFALVNISILELADFSLKIPSVALLFTVQLAFLVTSEKPVISAQNRGFIAKSAIAAIWLIVALFLVQWTVQDYRLYQSLRGGINEIWQFEQAVQGQPKEGKHWYQLGEKYLEQDNAEKAFEAFQEAVSLNPTVGRYWFALGKTQYQLGDIYQAREALESAHSWAPHKSGYLLFLTAIYLYESENAVSEFKRKEKIQRIEELSKEIRKLAKTPDENELKYWMGEYFAQKFKERLSSQT